MSGSRPQPIACPECAKTMEPWRLGPVEVDRCADCGGIWFDRGELGQAVQSLHSGGIPPVSDESAQTASARGVTCPACEPPQLLVARRWQTRLTYRRCPGCSGIFLQEAALGTIDGAVAALQRPPKRLTPGELATLLLEIATAGLG